MQERSGVAGVVVSFVVLLLLALGLAVIIWWISRPGPGPVDPPDRPIELPQPIPCGGELDSTTAISISGVKFKDDNQDGNWTPRNERTLMGWNILAYEDTDGSGFLSQEEYERGPVRSCLTNAYGAYEFILPARVNYIIAEAARDDMNQSGPRPRATPLPRAGRIIEPRSAPEDVSITDPAIALQPLGYFIKEEDAAPGEEFLSAHFGNYDGAPKEPPQPGAFELHGFKFDDLNGDGDWDQGAEPGLKDVAILAYEDVNEDGALSQNEYDRGPIETIETDAFGSYRLVLPARAAYVVLEEMQADMVQTAPRDNPGNADTPPATSDALRTPIVFRANPMDGRIWKLEPAGYVIAKSAARDGWFYLDVNFGNAELPPPISPESCTKSVPHPPPDTPPHNYCVPEFCPRVEMVRGWDKNRNSDDLRKWPKKTPEAWPDEHRRGRRDPADTVWRFQNYWFEDAWMETSRHNAQHFKQARVIFHDTDGDPTPEEVEVQCIYATKMTDPTGQVLDIIVSPDRVTDEAHAAESQRIVTYSPWARFYRPANNNNIEYRCAGRHDECKY